MHFEDENELFHSSDLHLGHKKILQYQPNRAFADVTEMDNAIIDNWNRVVRPSSTVIFHGDFAFASKRRIREYRERLNGRIIFLMGNHDYFREIVDTFGRENIFQALTYTVGPNRQPYHSCHHPMASWMHAEEGGWHTHGHYHAHEVDKNLYKRLDVGIDNHPRLCPFSQPEIRAFMDSRVDTPVRH